MHFDFIIYGEGLSAEIAALSLAQNNFKVCFIKNGAHNKNESNLFTFLSSGSVNYLSNILHDPSVLNEYIDIKKITCKLDKTSQDSNITFADNPEGKLGKIIPNKIIKKLLNSSLNKSENIEIVIKKKSIVNKTYDNKVSIIIDERKEITAKLFVLSSAADQNILNNLNFRFISHNLNQTALSMNVIGEFKKQGQAFQIFTTRGPLAFLPSSKNHASLVWSLKNNAGELNEDKSKLAIIVNQYLEEDIGKLRIDNIEAYELNFNYAKKLYDRNNIIIGNIAHNIHPIAGQGLNLSIKDISLLVATALKYTSIGYEINNKMLLDEFNQYRKIDNAAYSFGTLALDRVLSSKNRFISMITGLGIKILEKNNFAKEKIINSATGNSHFKSL